MCSQLTRALLIVAVAAAALFTGGDGVAARGADDGAPQLARHLQTYIAGDGFQALMLAAVNAERAKQGLAPLCTNKKLQASAQLHSIDQAKNNFMDHVGSSGSTLVNRVVAQKFDWYGLAENVAAGQVDIASVISDWMGSPGHRKNILGNYKFFGAGYAYNVSSRYRHYWTQNFGLSSTESCSVGITAPTPAPATTTSAPKPAPVASSTPQLAPSPSLSPTPPPAPTATTPKPTATVPALLATPRPSSPAPTQASLPPLPTLKPSSGISIRAQMLAAVNAERAKQGLAPLCANKKLQAAAQLHSEDQANNNFMGHTGSSGSTMADRAAAQGFSYLSLAENVAAGQTSVAEVVGVWMRSDDHRRNILSNNTFFGMGYAYSPRSTFRHHWTQLFGAGRRNSGEVCD